MEIKIPSNFINNCISLRNDMGEQVNEDDIFKKIYLTLKHDFVIDIEYDQITWTIINNKFQGVYIPLLNKVVYFTQMLNQLNKARSRNTYVSQNYKSAKKFATNVNASVCLSMNPFDLNKLTPRASTIKKDIKTIATDGVQINCSIQYDGSIFQSIEEYLQNRNRLKNKNLGNNSTYIRFNETSITVYGRLEGASGVDTINCCSIINKLNHRQRKLQFFNISEKNFNQNTLNEILRNDFTLLNENSTQEENEITLTSVSLDEERIDEILKRNQTVFVGNILKKYSSIPDFDLGKCFASQYNVEENLIGSHIYRYADIKNDYKNGLIDIKTAAHLIVSGDNGFLLCGTRDKEFEKGQIYFDIPTKTFKIDRSKLTEPQYEIVSASLKPNNFSNVKFTKEFIDNVRQHCRRVGITN